MKYVVLFSGGHSSSLCAIEAVKKYGKENVILLNHDISSKVEHYDIKRFKKQISDYLEIPITFVNAENYEEMTPIKTCIKSKAFKIKNGQELCTSRLKTEPFKKWLELNYPIKGGIRDDVSFLYGFDEKEIKRCERRRNIMLTMGYQCQFPLVEWQRTIHSTEEIGIQKPMQYEKFKHSNCIGCLKAGKQHWYIVYCLYPDIYKEAMEAEEIIGYSIIKNNYLKDLVPLYNSMKKAGIEPTEHIQQQKFWADVMKKIK